MNLGEIWGATDADKPKHTQEYIDELFLKGIRMGKRSLMDPIEKYFTAGDGIKYSDREAMNILVCTPEELDAFVLDNPDYFDIDRLPVIYQNFKKHLAEVEAEKTQRLFT